MACVRIAVASVMAAALCGSACADDTPQETVDGVGAREVWAGIDASATSWLVYTGTTFAPWGDVHADGWRVRSTGGYGAFTFTHHQHRKQTPVSVTKAYSDVSLGYQQRIGELTAKVFVGGARLATEFAAGSISGGRIDYGGKGSIELWLNLGTSAWASLDVSYATAQAAIDARSRVGWRVLPTFSAGVESGFNQSSVSATIVKKIPAGHVLEDQQDKFYGDIRAGGFVRYEWFGGEISASGGLAGQVYKPARGSIEDIDPLRTPKPYGTLNVIFQF